MSSARNICFLSTLLHNLKEKDHIRRKLNSKKKYIYMWNSIIIILICRRLESVEPVQQKIELPSPNEF